jgi:hypothetical protein
MPLLSYQNARKNHDVKTPDRSLKAVAQFKYIKMTVTNLNLIQNENKKALNKQCFHPFKGRFSHMLSNNTRVSFCLWVCMHVKAGV